MRLFRCQMPRRNAFYSSDPPRDKDKFPNPLSVRERCTATGGLYCAGACVRSQDV